MARAHPQSAYTLLRAASRSTVEDNGGLEACAAGTRVRRATIGAYTDRNSGDQFMPVDVVIDLERRLPRAHVLEAMAGILGYRLVRLDQEDVIACGYTLTAELAASIGQLLASFTAASADGHFSPEEAQRLVADAVSATPSLHGLIAWAQRLSKGEGAP